MTINKLVALERGNPSNSNGADVATTVNQLVDGLCEIESGLRASQRNTPSDPTSGKYIMYMDENTGDLIAKINFEGTTKTAIIVDYSAI